MFVGLLKTKAFQFYFKVFSIGALIANNKWCKELIEIL